MRAVNETTEHQLPAFKTSYFTAMRLHTSIITLACALTTATANLRGEPTDPTQDASPQDFAQELERSLWTTKSGCSVSEFVFTATTASSVTGQKAQCNKCAANQSGASTQCNGGAKIWRACKEEL